MASAGSPLNVQYGFEVGDSSVVSVGGSSVGFIEEGISIRVPREYSFLRSDQYAVPIDSTLLTKDVFVSFTMSEVLGDNLASAWDNGAYASSTVSVDSNSAGQVALVVTTKGEDACTRTITMSKAVSVGDGEWSLPFANKQTISAEFQGVGDTANSGRILSVVDS